MTKGAPGHKPHELRPKSGPMLNEIEFTKSQTATMKKWLDAITVYGCVQRRSVEKQDSHITVVGLLVIKSLKIVPGNVQLSPENILIYEVSPQAQTAYAGLH